MKTFIKAWCVYPGNNTFDEGCILVFAISRNKAKSLGLSKGPWIGLEYLDFKAKRTPAFDKYFNKNNLIIETNNELPKDAPDFFAEFY